MKKKLCLLTLFVCSCNEQKIISSSRERFFTILSAVCDRVESDYASSFCEQEIYEKMLSGVLSDFDPFSRYLSESEFQQLSETEVLDGFGVELDLQDRWALVLNVYNNSPAKEAGLKPLDRIVEINGDRATFSNAKKIKFLPSVSLTIEQEGGLLKNIKLTKRKINLQSVSCDITSQIAVLRILAFNKNTTKEMRAVLSKLQKKKLKGLVLDLRNNAGGLLEEGVEIARFFIEHGVIAKVKYRDDEDVYQAKGKDWMYGIPIVVFVNRYCASASELVAGALKDHGRATIVGERTFGKGSVQALIRLPGAGGLRLTTGYFYTPHGRVIHEQGITPNVVTHSFDDIEQYFKK
jgi:carboxyl-terminal processing protease